jgi:hypothetical protein
MMFLNHTALNRVLQPKSQIQLERPCFVGKLPVRRHQHKREVDAILAGSKARSEQSVNTDSGVDADEASDSLRSGSDAGSASSAGSSAEQSSGVMLCYDALQKGCLIAR